MLVLFSVRVLNDSLFGKELFIPVTVRFFRKCLSIFMCVLLSLLVFRVACGM